jgi:site-specific recombinase XerD
MKIYLKLLPKRNHIVLHIGHLQARKQIRVATCEPKYWDAQNNMIKTSHPEFEELYPYLMNIVAMSKVVMRKNIKDVHQAESMVFNTNKDPEFLKWIKEYISKKSIEAQNYEEKDNLLERNRVNGHIKHYNTVYAKLKSIYDTIHYSSIDARFARNLQERLLKDPALSRSTALRYMSRIKSLYAKMILDHDLEDHQPFKYAIAKDSARSFEGRRKKLEDEALKSLSSIALDGNIKRARDTFMVLFDLGGCDLTDLYFLKWTSIKKGRIYFKRSKIRGSSMDLKVTARVQQYLDDYALKGNDYVFPWRKDSTGYTTWRDNARRDLKKAAKMAIYKDTNDKKTMVTDISGGEITMKCARHTFASRGKSLGIDVDILREIMGHRRNDVDNFYKDAYSNEVRDAAQLKIIEL